MQFNCDTKHGPALVTVDRTATGAQVLIQWRPVGNSSPIARRTYTFEPPLPSGMTSTTPDSEYAHRAVSHFDSVADPYFTGKVTLTAAEAEINHGLRLVPVG